MVGGNAFGSDRTSAAVAAVLAHQGGWDETLSLILVFAAPAVLAVLAIRWAERRSRRRAGQEDQ